MDARVLIETIRKEKNDAVAAGILREEKPLAAITDKEIPRRLPEGWQWCRLGDYAMKVTDYVASGSFASLKENVLITNEENYAVMVKTADFSNGFTKNLTYTDKKGYKFLENSNLFGGELILSNIGSIGKVFIVSDLQRPMTLASNTVMIRMTHIEYNKYMYYMFTSPFGQKLLMSISSGTSMLKFNKTQLKSTVIPIAPLERQNEICNVLDKVKVIIDKRKTELEKLDNLIKARFVEMFGDLADPTCKWEKCRLVDTCVNSDDIKCGPFGTQLGKNEYTEEGVAVWEIPQINSEFKTSPTHFVTEKKAAELDAYSIIPGDIAMSRKGNVGRCAVFPATFENGIIHSDVLRIRLNEAKAVPEFMMRQLHYSGDIQHQIELVSSGAIMAGINVTKLKQIFVYLPPIELQNEFVAFVTQVDKSKAVIQKSLDETQLLFDSLMQKYFG